MYPFLIITIYTILLLEYLRNNEYNVCVKVNLKLIGGEVQMKKIIALFLALCLVAPLPVKAAGQESTEGESSGKPVLERVSLTTNQGNSSSTDFTMTVQFTGGEIAEDTTQPAVTVEYVVGDKDNGIEYSWTLWSTGNQGEYRGKLDMSICPTLSKYLYFKEIQVKSAEGEWFTYKPAENYDITLEDYSEDTEAPTLDGYYFENEQVYTPGQVILNVQASDDASRIDNIEAKLYSSDSDEVYYEMQYNWPDSYPEPGQTGNYQMKYTFPRYSESQTYYVDEITLTDITGKSRTYSLAAGTLTEKKEVRIINENRADLITSTTDANMISSISSLPEGSTAVVDIAMNSIIPKALFETIKGKDITVIFEKISTDDQGIQWIVNGKDVVNETKDIDANVYIKQSYNTNWIKKQEAKHGSEMPGKTGDTFPGLDNDALKKKELRDGGWEDVIPEIEKMKRPGDSFMDVFLRLMFGYPYLEIVFPDNGLLPCKSTIHIDADYAMKEFVGVKDLKLYYYNPEIKEFKLEQEGLDVQNDKYYEFPITHNSTYALTAGFDDVDKLGDNSGTSTDDETKLADGKNSEAPTSDSSKAGTVKTGDENNILIYMLLAMFGLAVSVVEIRRKYIMKR